MVERSFHEVDEALVCGFKRVALRGNGFDGFRCEYEAVDDLGQRPVGEGVGRQDRGTDAAAGGPGDADRDDRCEDRRPYPVPDRAGRRAAGDDVTAWGDAELLEPFETEALDEGDALQEGSVCVEPAAGFAV